MPLLRLDTLNVALIFQFTGRGAARPVCCMNTRVTRWDADLRWPLIHSRHCWIISAYKNRYPTGIKIR